MANRDDGIFNAIAKALQVIGPGLQEIGVGVSGITGETTQAQTLEAQRTLEKLKQGKLDAQSQREMAVEFEKQLNQPGAKQSLTQSSTGAVSRTVTQPDPDQLQFVQNEDGTFSVAKDEFGQPIHGKAKIIKPQKKEKEEKTGIKAFSISELQKTIADETLPDESRAAARKEFITRSTGLTEKELQSIKPSILDKILQAMIDPAGLAIESIKNRRGGKVETPTKRVRMVDKDGNEGMMLASQVEKAKLQGWKLA